MELKVGMPVVCKEGRHISANNPSFDLEKGRIYVISDLTANFDSVTLEGFKERSYSLSRFELAKDITNLEKALYGVEI